MSNLTDALIAAKLVGGSGGSGGGSGLPEIRTETVTALDDDVVIEESGGSAAARQALASGDSVTVSWDGTSYSCVATEVSEGSVTSVVFGNLSIVEMGEDTGEPFLFIQMEQGGMVGYRIITSAADGTYHVTVSAVHQEPANGNLLIVEEGQWVTKSLNEMIPSIPTIVRTNVYIDSTTTVPANAEAQLTFSGFAEEGYYVLLHGYFSIEDSIQPFFIGFGAAQSHTVVVDVRNATSSPITLTGGSARLEAWFVKVIG